MMTNGGQEPRTYAIFDAAGEQHGDTFTVEPKDAEIYASARAHANVGGLPVGSTYSLKRLDAEGWSHPLWSAEVLPRVKL